MDKILEMMKFDDRGLVPAVIQDEDTNRVLMMAYMNREALRKTLKTGFTHFYSRSRKKLWKKGETSGHVQQVVSVSPDCDCDTLLVRVRQNIAACHTGHYSCFYRKFEDGSAAEQDKVFNPGKVYGRNEILDELYQVISGRKENPKEGSYTCYLFGKGIDKILKKVGEESSEVIIASKNNDRNEIVYETADLFYHIYVMLVQHGIKPEEVYDELRRRR